MNELYKNDIKGKLYRLIFEMNKDTVIQILTPVGLSEEANTGEGFGQGTPEGAVVSAVNLDNGVREFFNCSEYEVCYANLLSKFFALQKLYKNPYQLCVLQNFIIILTKFAYFKTL